MSLILYNASFYRSPDRASDGRFERGVLRSDRGKIAALGAPWDLDAIKRPGDRLVDLQGAYVTPGFYDAHMHILPYGLDLLTADLSPLAGVRDIPTLVGALRGWSDERPGAVWIRGGRYDQNTFPGAAHPTRVDLDGAFPDRPVYIVQTSKHAASCNTVALQMAGVFAETADPPDGEIVRDARGEPTGVLLEGAMGLVSRLLPKPGRAEMVAAIRRACDALSAKGITSACDMNTGAYDLLDELAAYRQAAAEGAPVRMTLYIHAPEFGDSADLPLRREFAAAFGPESVGPGGVRIGGLKLFSDGALTVRTAWLKEPYTDAGGYGMPMYEEEELRAWIRAGHGAGWQVAVHAIGDRAIQEVVDAFDAADEAFPREDCRHRIEHAMLTDLRLRTRMSRLGLVAALQPEFLSRLGDAYAMGLGQERASRLNAAASLSRLGVPVAFSSDCPIVPGAPLDGIRAAADRITPSGLVLGIGERLPPLTSIDHYTRLAAFSAFDEGETGSLELGKRADLAVISHDLGEPDNLAAANVLGTFLAGDQVYGSEFR